MLRRGISTITPTLAEMALKSTVPAEVKVFDREMKRKQRSRAASSSDFDTYRYVKDEFGARIADRVYDLTGYREVCVDLGCGAGHIAPHLIKENVGTLIQCDMSEVMARHHRHIKMATHRLVADEETVPFRDSSIDLILSSLAAHWINDLPGWFRRCLTALRPDGCMIGSLLAGETLHELRVSLQLAEMERLGGVGAHISPFVEAQDVAALMNRAGFAMVTLDVDEMRVDYPNVFALLYDLQGMAESRAASRCSNNLRREVLLAADCIYRAMYATDERYLPMYLVHRMEAWAEYAEGSKARITGSLVQGHFPQQTGDPATATQQCDGGGNDPEYAHGGGEIDASTADEEDDEDA